MFSLLVHFNSEYQFICVYMHEQGQQASTYVTRATIIITLLKQLKQYAFWRFHRLGLYKRLNCYCT